MEKSLINYLKQIPDFRHPSGRRHPLWLVLLITILGIMSGNIGYRSIERFIERHRTELIKELKIPKARVPSYSTVRRVMKGLDYCELTKAFNEWANQFRNELGEDWIAIDGKSLRNTVKDYNKSSQNFINMVSAFTHKRGIVMGIGVISNKKTSEIPCVQELLEILNLKGVAFTLDALHCQKKTVEFIVESGNDYIIKVKRNQKSLFDSIKQQSEKSSPVKTYHSKEKTRGRLTERIVSVFNPPANIDEKWLKVGCVIKVQRLGNREGKEFNLVGYYLCSLEPSSKKIVSGIRQHWEIENRLHWVKDVVFQEDTSPQLAGFSPINFSHEKLGS